MPFFFRVFFFKGIRVLVLFPFFLRGGFFFFFWQYIAFFSQIRFHLTYRKWRHSREPYTSLLLAPLEEQAPWLSWPALRATARAHNFLQMVQLFPCRERGCESPHHKIAPEITGDLPLQRSPPSPPSQGLHSQGCTAPGVPLYLLPASPGLSPTPRAALPSRGGPREAVQGPGRLSFLQLPSHGPGETPEIKGSAADQVSSLVHRPRLIKLLTHKEIKPGPLPAVG